MKKLSEKLLDLPVSAALAVDLRAKQMASEGRSVISFCVGEPDFPSPDAACDAGCSAIIQGDTRYTNAPGTPELRAASASALNRDYGLDYLPEEIAVTTGGKYAVYAAVCALTEPGDEIILPAPYWTSYYYIIRLAGAVPVVVPCREENGWKLTPQAFRDAVTERTSAVILNNPNNPSGAVYSRSELSALAEAFQKADVWVIADEIYSCFNYSDEPFCAAASLNADMRARTVTVNGVSKAYAMTGWRIGFAAGDRQIIACISAMLSHTTGCPNTIAQMAAAAVLRKDGKTTREMSRAFRQRRDRLTEMLRNVPGIRFTEPEGAFYLMPVLSGSLAERYPDASAFAMELLEKTGTAVVPCADYGIINAFRMSYSLPMTELEKGAERLRAFCEAAVGENPKA